MEDKGCTQRYHSASRRHLSSIGLLVISWIQRYFEPLLVGIAYKGLDAKTHLPKGEAFVPQEGCLLDPVMGWIQDAFAQGESSFT